MGVLKKESANLRQEMVAKDAQLEDTRRVSARYLRYRTVEG